MLDCHECYLSNLAIYIFIDFSMVKKKLISGFFFFFTNNCFDSFVPFLNYFHLYVPSRCFACLYSTTLTVPMFLRNIYSLGNAFFGGGVGGERLVLFNSSCQLCHLETYSKLSKTFEYFFKTNLW